MDILDTGPTGTICIVHIIVSNHPARVEQNNIPGDEHVDDGVNDEHEEHIAKVKIII